MWRVLHLITQLELGGAQLATLEQVAHGRFGKRRLLGYGPGGQLDGETEKLTGVQCMPISHLVRSVSPIADALAVVEIARLVRGLRRQGRLLVHTHSSKAGIVGRLGAYLGGADCIVHSVHGFGHSHHGGWLSRRLFTLAERLAARVTDGFTSDSQQNIDDGRAQHLFAGRPARVVRCGVRLDAFAEAKRSRAAMRRALDLPANAEVVLNVSCLKPQKDPLTFAEVAAEVLSRRPRAHFLIAGDGELRSALEQRATALGLGERFRLLGWRRDVPDLLHASDVLMLTSRWEGLPQVLPQAMAARLPIVATHVDGVPEAVVDNGILVAPGDVAAMSAAVQRLLGNAALRRKFGERGAARSREFSAEGMLRALDQLYEELTGEVTLAPDKSRAKRRAPRRRRRRARRE
jgi:glycosyltransferase involved in cell wall biosynthesis